MISWGRRVAERSADDLALAVARVTLGMALVSGLGVAITMAPYRSCAPTDHLVRKGRLLAWGVPATGVLVQTLLDRGADGDVAEAEAGTERLAAAPTDDGLAVRDIWLLRMRALLARARRDDAAYAQFRDRYRDMAKTLGFDGHIAWAEAMT